MIIGFTIFIMKCIEIYDKEKAIMKAFGYLINIMLWVLFIPKIRIDLMAFECQNGTIDHYEEQCDLNYYIALKVFAILDLL
jgi:hypothetical protein